MSALDLSKVKRARALQRRLGRPNTGDCIHCVSSFMIPNYPVIIHNIKDAEFIWILDLRCVKGKTAKQVSPKENVENTSIPVPFMQHYNNITLTVNITRLAGIQFQLTIPRHLEFVSTGKLDRLKHGHILKYFKALISAYVTSGFKVARMLADIQFEPILVVLHTRLHITF